MVHEGMTEAGQNRMLSFALKRKGEGGFLVKKKKRGILGEWGEVGRGPLERRQTCSCKK